MEQLIPTQLLVHLSLFLVDLFPLERILLTRRFRLCRLVIPILDHSGELGTAFARLMHA